MANGIGFCVITGFLEPE